MTEHRQSTSEPGDPSLIATRPEARDWWSTYLPEQVVFQLRRRLDMDMAQTSFRFHAVQFSAACVLADAYLRMRAQAARAAR
jgi:hypothetical protein